jgi:hypothetical protein
MRYSDSPVGRIVTQYDYDDYRPGGGRADPVQVDAHVARRAFRISTDPRAAKRQHSSRSLSRVRRAATLIGMALETQMVEFVAHRFGNGRCLLVSSVFAVPVFAHHGRCLL